MSNTMSSTYYCIQLCNPTVGLNWSPKGSLCVKRIALGQLPRALCLHLRRAYWTNTGRHIKLTGHVRFPLTLDPAPYCAANLLPLPSLSQQYVPDSTQSFWIGTHGHKPCASSGKPVSDTRMDRDTKSGAEFAARDADAMIGTGRSAGKSTAHLRAGLYK